MPQRREGVSGGSRRDPQFGTRVRTERDDHRAATRLERGVGVADETVVSVNRRYRGDVTASWSAGVNIRPGGGHGERTRTVVDARVVVDRNADTVLDTIVDLHRRHLGLGADATGTRRGRHNRNLTQLREALGVGRCHPQPGRSQRDGERAGGSKRSHAPVIDGHERGVSAATAM